MFVWLAGRPAGWLAVWVDGNQICDWFWKGQWGWQWITLLVPGYIIKQDSSIKCSAWKGFTKFLSKKIFGPKKISNKNFGLKKILVWKKILVQKTILLKRKIWSKKMLVQKKFWSKKILVPKKFWSEKKFVQKNNVGPKKFWSKRNLSPKKYFGRQIFWK